MQLASVRIAEVNQWLNSSRPFSQGVALYEKHAHLKPNAGAQIIIKGVQSSLSESVLARELQAIFDLDDGTHEAPEIRQIVKPAAASKASRKYSPEILAAMPKRLQSIQHLLKKLYGQLDSLRGRMLAEYYDGDNKLRQHPDSDAGGAIALKILDVDKRIRMCYAELDDWVENGAIEPACDEDEVEFLRDSLESVVRISYYIKRNESRVRKGEKLPSPEKLSEAQKTMQTINEYLKKHGRRPVS